MKLLKPSQSRRQNASAVIVVLALLSIILLYVAANVRSLHQLGGELKLVEQQQIRRLNLRAGSTNAVTTQLSPSGANPALVSGATPQQSTSR